MCICVCEIAPLPFSDISDYLSFLVGSVVSIATLLSLVSGERLLEPLWVLLVRCKSDWECQWQSSTHQTLWWSRCCTAECSRTSEAFVQRLLLVWFDCSVMHLQMCQPVNRIWNSVLWKPEYAHSTRSCLHPLCLHMFKVSQFLPRLIIVI